jgi:hypothetical protein
LLKRLQPNSRIGLALAASYLLLGACWAWLYNQVWIGALLPYLLYWIVALSCVAGRGIDAAKDPGLTGLASLRAIVVIPLLVVGAKVVDVAIAPGERLAAAASLAVRSGEMQVAQRRAGPGRAAAIHYMEGIPDGGAALIRHSGGNPEALPRREHSRLVGERIYLCLGIGRIDWICWYD